MRHGWEWWETFWKWYREEHRREALGRRFVDYPKVKYKEFEELWRTGKISLPPKG